MKRRSAAACAYMENRSREEAEVPGGPRGARQALDGFFFLYCTYLPYDVALRGQLAADPIGTAWVAVVVWCGIPPWWRKKHGQVLR